ncbi:MAG: radical SAM protein [Spirochaetes bacterium]|nr:radical SAM protein [Spirochaetota bacterium]
MNIKNRKKEMPFSDKHGNVFEYPGLEAAFRTGRRFIGIKTDDLIPLPGGSELFSMPGRYPVFHDRKSQKFSAVKNYDGEEIWAAAAFLSSGYLRTYLPAYEMQKGARPLSLWAYSGLAIIDGGFFVPAVRIDNDPRSDPEIHDNDSALKKKIKALYGQYPQNRLVKQLAHCASDYRCLCARNFFLSRYEAPVPTSPSCNANCAGCLSHQTGSGFKPSQYRIDFRPSPDEIAQVILHHFERVDRPVTSFGQGCEGEPLLRGKDLAKAVELVRGKTGKGTINMNTNGSRPDMVETLIKAGLDSIRISLNSPTEKYYNNYFRPKNYSYADVIRSLETAINHNIFVSINLFFLPGFTDMDTEVESLFQFLKMFPVNMIQTRNLNIDPDYYLDVIKFRESEPLGIKNLISMIRKKYPGIKLGYYNPPKENF